MILYYVRHGDPIYSPDSLTPLGERQAEAIAKRLSVYGLDKIYCSPLIRAQQTARPTCEMLKMEAETVDFLSEAHAAECTQREPRYSWLFYDPLVRPLFATAEMRELGFKWYEHPEIKEYDFGKGINTIYDDCDGFMRTLGYEHIRYSGRYNVIRQSNERIALFAHQGFGLAFLSCLLDIPYPTFSTNFDIGHTGMTVIEFREENGYSIPKVCTLSNDSHLYKEGLPTNYNNQLRY